MLNPNHQVERPAAAGGWRAPVSGCVVSAAHLGAFDRGRSIPTPMSVPGAKHTLTFAPRPEEAVP